nr:SpaA isopeptide-forming pilin-related protein [uncultured Blautia sp.]
MKKMVKKLSALLMAVIMVLAMSATAFAADLPATASITINNLTPNDSTNVKIYKVVSHDAANSTWDAVDWAKDYVIFPSDSTTTEAAINWVGLKEYVDQKAVPFTAEMETNDTKIVFDGLEAGAYLVIATGATTEYSVMGVATYKYDENNNLLAPLSAVIDAKGEGYVVTKTLNEQETLVHRGQELTFNIDSYFPSFPANTKDREVTITDTPTGQYVKSVEVYVGGMETPLTENTDYTLTFANGSTALPAAENEAVTVNFTSDYIGMDNIHAAKAIRVVVTTVVTDVATISNSATGSHDSDPDIVNTKTGSITINKVDKEKNLLTGAQFSITKKDEEAPLEFVKVSDGVYKLATENDPENADKFTVLDVGANDPVKGILTAKGLGEGIYEIKEVKAPEGYSIVNVDDVELKLGETTENVSIDVINTKLSSLPSTGGIGTTIFTIGGCVIMIVAAGLYFSTHKKEEN